MFHNSQAVLALSLEQNPTVFQKTLGLNDFYFGADGLRLPAGQHPDGRQVLGRRCTAARSRCRRSSRPTGRWTRSPATPSTSGSRPRTCRGPTTASRCDATGSIALALHSDQRGPARSGCSTSCSPMLAHLGMHHATSCPRHAYLKNDIPVAGVAHQAGTCRFGDDPATVGARRQLPRARGRQPLRRRHELLPQHRRGEPGADGDGQRACASATTCSSAWARRRPGRSPLVSPEAESAGPHVVVVGGGFAGVGCARRLADRKDVRVTLLDRNNYHQFQPLLYQVATSQLAPSRRRVPAPQAAPQGRQRRHQDRRGHRDRPRRRDRTVTTADGESYRATRWSSPAGARSRTSSARRAEEHAFPLYALKTPPRRAAAHVLAVFEDADRDPSARPGGAELRDRRRPDRRRDAGRSPTCSSHLRRPSRSTRRGSTSTRRVTLSPQGPRLRSREVKRRKASDAARPRSQVPTDMP